MSSKKRIRTEGALELENSHSKSKLIIHQISSPRQDPLRYQKINSLTIDSDAEARSSLMAKKPVKKLNREHVNMNLQYLRHKGQVKPVSMNYAKSKYITA